MTIQEKLQAARQAAKETVKLYFKDDYGNPYQMTHGQADIFNSILSRSHPRIQIIAPRQYGKSDAISMAVLIRSRAFAEKWAIVAGQKDKAMIIMNRVIQHAFDHEYFYESLELDKSQSLDRLRRERSKDHISWAGGGSVQIFTADTKNKQRTKEALTGFGSPNVIADEASLVPNDSMGMILSMLGGHKDNFLLKVGNPFYRNHFLKTWHSDRYKKIFIDYHQALTEGRYTEDYIEEMRNEPFFDILYECKFPDINAITIDGYRKLISDELLESAFITEDEGKELMQGRTKLGGDFAGGGNDRSAYVIRWPKVMKLIETNKIADTMQQVPIVERFMSEYNVADNDVSLDYGGLGQGVVDRLKEKDRYVNGVMFGGSSPDTTRYKNMRAYMYYQLYNWLKDGGKIIRNDSFYELSVVNYKEDSERKFQIQPKEELKKVLKELGITATSPDIADAAALTFADNSHLITESDFAFV